MFDDHSFGTSMEVPIRIPANCSQCGFDGTSICIPTANSNQLDVLVVDATTYEVIGTIETLGANSVAAAGGALWSSTAPTPSSNASTSTERHPTDAVQRP